MGRSKNQENTAAKPPKISAAASKKKRVNRQALAVAQKEALRQSRIKQEAEETLRQSEIKQKADAWQRTLDLELEEAKKRYNECFAKLQSFLEAPGAQSKEKRFTVAGNPYTFMGNRDLKTTEVLDPKQGSWVELVSDPDSPELVIPPTP